MTTLEGAVVLVTGPLWNLIPWTWTPREKWLGQLRWGMAVFNCHVGLLTWPCAYFLGRSLFSQTRWMERIKMVALLVVCVWIS